MALYLKSCLLLSASLALLCTGQVYGLAAHEVLVLANRNENISVRIARAYMQKRMIPRQNLVLLDISADETGQYTSMERDQFTARIWEPAQSVIRQRNVDHVLAWVFSTHIPYRVDHTPAISVQGLVFLKNRLPAHDAIAKAEYASPLFVGPVRPDGNVLPPQSLRSIAAILRENMPIPAIALGYMGERGNTESEIMEMLERSHSADASAPSGSIYFVTGEDIRARVREWQFKDMRDRLYEMGVDAVVTNSVPRASDSILGVMMGARSVDPEAMGTFLPGAFAEHLTSYGAMFDESSQTKVTRWIAAGASSTAGTVTEPYAIWAKFPHARFYLHYRSGYSLLESFYLSTRSPLQSFLIGDPLMAPWAPVASVRLLGIRDQELIRGKREVTIQIDAPSETAYDDVVYLINGVVVAGQGESLILDATELGPGLHELRVAAYRAGIVSNPITDTIRFQIAP